MPFVNSNLKNGGPAKYSQVNLDDFSDDDDDNNRIQPAQNNNNNGVDGSLNRQQQLFMEQDQGLEMLGQSADRLGKMSMAIHEELGFQNKMLDEMENELDEAGENLDMITKKTKEFIEKAGGTKNCIIIVALSAIAILLFFLILYT